MQCNSLCDIERTKYNCFRNAHLTTLYLKLTSLLIRHGCELSSMSKQTGLVYGPDFPGRNLEFVSGGGCFFLFFLNSRCFSLLNFRHNENGGEKLGNNT